MLTINAMTTADTVLVPIQCEYYALEGLSQLMATIRQVKRLYNPSIEMEGVLLTMFDGRLNLTIQVVEEVKKYFPNKVYRTTIPRNVRLSEAPSFGMPIMYFDKACKGSTSYMALAQEIINNNTIIDVCQCFGSLGRGYIHKIWDMGRIYATRVLKKP